MFADIRNFQELKMTMLDAVSAHLQLCCLAGAHAGVQQHALRLPTVVPVREAERVRSGIGSIGVLGHDET
jgi:hypothetical protein